MVAAIKDTTKHCFVKISLKYEPLSHIFILYVNYVVTGKTKLFQRPATAGPIIYQHCSEWSKMNKISSVQRRWWVFAVDALQPCGLIGLDGTGIGVCQWLTCPHNQHDDNDDELSSPQLSCLVHLFHCHLICGWRQMTMRGTQTHA